MKKAILVILCGVTIFSVQAQWTGTTDISNTNTGNVGIGNSSPAYKLDVTGQARIDAGAGTGPILRLRLNNGSGYFYADASSDLHFTQRFHVDLPFFPDGGLQFNSYGTGIALNTGPISGVSSLAFSSAGSNIKMYCDYNVSQLPQDQGIIVKYVNKTLGYYPQAVFQTYKDGDPTENPFLISARGFGWLKNSKTDEVAWIVKGATSQTADIEQWQDGSGNVLANVTASGKMGIGTSSSTYKLNVNGDAEIGDNHDPNAYGMLQIVRPSNQPDNKHHLSFIRNGASVAGMGYAPNSNVLGIWHANDNSGTPLIGMTYDQKVGISVSNPAEKLTVGGADGNIHIGGTLFGEGYNGIFLNGSTNPLDYNFLSKASDKNLYINRPNNSNIFFRQANATQMVILDGGNVGIGTTSPGTYKLAVEGTIGARKVKVTTTSWADFVFENDYQLPTLNEVDHFIQQNKHLPGVPSAKEVQETGLDLGDNQAILLKKIEELTLYIIEQNKKIEAQEIRIKKLEDHPKK